jgi:hypothetical protein
MALRAYGHFELPPLPEVATLASELRLFSGMVLPPDRLPTTGVSVFSLFTNTVRFALLLHSERVDIQPIHIADETYMSLTVSR